MKKYIFIIMLSIITLAGVNWASAQTTEQACSSKKNGDACTYTRSSGRDSSTNQTGYCERNVSGTLYCSSNLKAWEDCFDKSVEGDACFGTTGGGRGGTKELGTCTKITSRGGERSSGTTTMTCDTSKKPPGNPGGRNSATQNGADSGVTTSCVTNAEKDNKCGTAPKCTGNQVCANVDGTTKCVTNAEKDNKCGTAPKCTGNQVCVSQSSTSSGANPGGTSGATDASSPQTVGFINPSRFNSITELIAGIINALLGILGAITVAVLVASGFKYMTSSNPGEVGQALEGIRNAIVGLMIIMGAFLITQYVITALAV